MTRPNDKPSARCPACDRRYAIEGDRGVLRMHLRGRSGETCPGSGMAPKGGVRS